MNIATATRRPGRPKSEQKAEAIREAAACLFLTEGLAQTSMDAIAQAAGVSKQTVYSHFKSKDDLFRACVASKVELYGLGASHYDPGVPVDEALARIGRQFLTLLGDDEVVQMFRLMIAQATAFPRIVESFHECGPKVTVDNVTQIFSDYMPDAAEQTANRAACDFLAMIKSEFFVERLLGTRRNMSAKELGTHVDHCVAQIQKLYPLTRHSGNHDSAR